MHLFSNYIQPLSIWLYGHPDWALFITFLISFSESLAIVGTIIPGSVTMTAIGILAGSGVLRIDLTYLAATLGAIAGDGGSYALGAIFSDRLTTIWPFNKHPKWLNYGQQFFVRYGQSSVFIGRFFGPMRSIVPVIAGMMHMNHWQFFLANTLSAIGWSLLYITPGVLIGAASTELPPDAAARLCLFILVFLAIVWLTSIGIRSLIAYAKNFMRKYLSICWRYLKKHPQLSALANLLTPEDELNYYPTALLTLSSLFFFCLSFILVSLVILNPSVEMLDHSAYQFFQSLCTKPFDVFFIIVSLAISPIPVITLIFASILYAVYDKNYRPLGYGISLLIFAAFTVFLLTYIVDINKQNPFAINMISPFFPDLDLTVATAVYGFLIFFMSHHSQSMSIQSLRLLFTAILLFGGIGRLYLGDNLLTSILSAYLVGLFICILHWIFYRKRKSVLEHSQLLIYLSCLLVILATLVTNVLNYKSLFRSHHHQIPQYIITEKEWWNEKQPMLPIYSTNRFGQHVGLLNIQYVGSITKLQDTLVMNGWTKHPDSFFYALLLRAGGQHHDIPFITQLVQNKKPSLMLSYMTDNNQTMLILRLWRSNYHLYKNRQPIWVGSIGPLMQSSTQNTIRQQLKQNMKIYDYLKQILHEYKWKQKTISGHYLHPIPQAMPPILLLIKE